MRYLKKTFLLITFSFLFAACIGNLDAQRSDKSPSWNVLIEGKNSALHEPKNVLIKSREEFEALWAQTHEGIDYGPQIPPVDFTKKWVIASFLGAVKTGGHAIEIQSIEPGKSSALITLIHKKPGVNCITAQVIQFPYIVAAVDQFSSGKAEFNIITVDAPCK